MAAKKPAKKAAKASKTHKPAAKAPARKPAAKKPAKAPAKKAAAKKAPAKVVKKPAAKPAKAPARKAMPAKKAAPAKAAPAKAAPGKAIGREALVGPVKVQTPHQPPAPKPAVMPTPKPAPKPVAKPVARELAQTNTHVPRPVGKVAVAVVAKPAAPAQNRKLKVVPYKTDEATGRPILPSGYRPTSDEEYMGPLQIEYFRQRLLHWRADLVEESKQTIENLKDEVRDVGDEAERATRETENSLELRTRDRYRKLIGKIDKALRRIEDGEYGYCEETGEEIGLDRLEARPIATLCLDAQERWEHRQRQMGD